MIKQATIGSLEMNKGHVDYSDSECQSIESNAKSQAQYRKVNQELEQLQYELWCFVLIVVRLLRRTVVDLVRNRRQINIAYVEFRQHCRGGAAVADILEILACVLPC